MKLDRVTNWNLPGISPVPASPGSRGRILVVDDDISIRHASAMMLARFGFEVDVAEDGDDAWEILQQGGYDLLITDNNMPRMSGLDLLKKLHAARMDLPFIMATGAVPLEEFIRYPWIVPAATLLKPYSISELFETVEKILQDGAAL
ncbi:MAG: response regulator [Verrucomicrobiota bacterium]